MLVSEQYCRRTLSGRHVYRYRIVEERCGEELRCLCGAYPTPAEEVAWQRAERQRQADELRAKAIREGAQP